ncbi:hypothetical protein M2G82_20070 [Vibrio vulnificus]|nr:hypothetical protein [Vibrio vulnificus]
MLFDELQKTLLPGMFMPKPFELLFSWIEANNMFIDIDHGRIGLLYPEELLRSGWTDSERPGGTIIEFLAAGNINLPEWFGHNRPDVMNRLCVFAKTGADGSMAAFWIDEEGKQKIVHLGSGSGSILTCVLADDPIDFLRLLAIGYDEICNDSEFSTPPNSNCRPGDVFVHPNINFRNWVESTFKVSIPETALEIVKCPAKMGESNSSDPFCRWVEFA